jgi:hypothetical protein
MAEKERFIRVEDNDPTRCHAVNVGASKDQCHFQSVPGSKWCPLHGGAKQEDLNKKAALAGYRLQQWNERVADFANDGEVKSLRAEIGIMRMTLENLLTQCDNANKLLVYSDKISQLVGQIGKLIDGAQRLEEKNNNLLDRKVVIVIADSIVTLIGQYITDPDKLTEIGSKICESIANAASPTNSARVVTQSGNAS